MTNRQIFNGGNLEIQILDAEKYGGTDKIFGKGRYSSSIRVVSGHREVGRSIVENAKILYIDKETTWGGYDSNFKIMKILPTLKPSVKLLIYDCDRENENDILGEAKLVLKDAISPSPVKLSLSITTKNSSGKEISIGTLVITALFQPNPVPMYNLQDKIPLNTSKSRNFFIGIGWDDEFKLPGVTDQSFGASFAVFTTEGSLVESVHLPQWREKKILQSSYQRIQPKVEDGYTTDKLKISFNLESQINPATANVVGACVVLSSLTDFQTLQPLQNMYCRIVDERSNLEIGRYCLGALENPVTSCMLLRLQRETAANPEEPVRWCITPQRLFDYTARSCGPFLPALKAKIAELLATPGEGEGEAAPPRVLKPSDRVGYIHTTEQTYCLESFYDVNEENVSTFSGEVGFGIRWEESTYPPGRAPSQLDMDIAAVVLDSKFNVLDRIAGAGLPIPPKPPAAPKASDEEGEEPPPPEPEPEEDAVSPPPVSSNGSLIHGGEIAAERVEGTDDHSIQIKLKGVDEHPDSTYLAIYTSSLSGKSFHQSQLVGCYAHLFDSASQQELISYEITDTAEFSRDTFFTSSTTSVESGVLLAILFKFESKWYAMSCMRPLRGAPPDMTMEPILNTVTGYLNEVKPLQLQLRLNTHNTTQVKRYGHVTS